MKPHELEAFQVARGVSRSEVRRRYTRTETLQPCGGVSTGDMLHTQATVKQFPASLRSTTTYTVSIGSTSPVQLWIDATKADSRPHSGTGICAASTRF